MKKIITAIIALVVVVVAAIFLTGHGNGNKSAATKKVPTVGILQLMSHPALDQIHKGGRSGSEGRRLQWQED